MIACPQLVDRVRTALRRSRVVALVGPRQCGKTTLARQVSATGHYFDLENPISLRLLDEPMTALEGLRGLIVIDEVQRRHCGLTRRTSGPLIPAPSWTCC